MIAWILPIVFQPDTLQESLNGVLNDPALKGAAVTATVTRMDGTEVFQRNGDMRLTPASNEKIFTCLYALDSLTPKFQAQTRIWLQHDRVLVDAPGDPSLTLDRVRGIAKTLEIKKGLPIYVRQAYRPYIPPSWEADDLSFRYAAPICSFSIDRAGFELYASDQKIEPIPSEFNLKVVHKDAEGLPVVEYDRFKKLIVVTGKLPEARQKLETLCIPEPDSAACAALGGAYKWLGSVPSTPPDATLSSRPLLELVAHCLQISDNNYAEHLLLMAAGKKSGLGGDPYSAATKRISKFLTDSIGLTAEQFHIDDGSGLSRHNVVCSRAFVKALVWAKKQPFGSDFVSSLAQPGRDTLSGRLIGSTFRGKTGTSDLVNSLSGYVVGRDGNTYAVSIIVNHALAESAVIRGILDRFVQAIESNAGNGTILEHAARNEEVLPFGTVTGLALDWVR